MEREAVNLALSLAMLVSPTEAASFSFSLMVNEMHAAGCPDEQVVEELVGAIHDGLSKGNWPKLDTDQADSCCTPDIRVRV